MIFATDFTDAKIYLLIFLLDKRCKGQLRFKKYIFQKYFHKAHVQYEAKLSHISKLQPLLLFHMKVINTLQQKQTKTERTAPLLAFAEFLLKAT